MSNNSKDLKREVRDALWLAYRHLRDVEALLSQAAYLARQAEADDEGDYPDSFVDFTDHIHLLMLPRLRKVIGTGTDVAGKWTVMGLIND